MHAMNLFTKCLLKTIKQTKIRFVMFMLILSQLVFSSISSTVVYANDPHNMFWMGPYSAATGSGTVGTIENCAADNFSIGGLTYALGADYQVEIDEWLEHDVNIIYRLAPVRTVSTFGEIGTFVRNKKTEVPSASAEQMDIWVNQITQLIEGVLADPDLNEEVIAWYIGPEETRPWKANEVELLRRIYQEVKRLDPQLRPAFSYNPTHSKPERISQIGEYQDILSMGVYPNAKNRVHQRGMVANAINQLKRTNEVMGTNKPIVPVLEMLESSKRTYTAEEAALIPNFVQHDAYAAIANGADGFLIWSMRNNREGFKPENYAKYYNAYAKFSNETEELGLRELFLEGNVVNKVTATVTSGEETITFVWAKFDEILPSLSVRHWQDDDDEFILIVNSSEGSVEFDLQHQSEFLNSEYVDMLTGDILATDTSQSVSLKLASLGVLMLSSDVD